MRKAGEGMGIPTGYGCDPRNASIAGLSTRICAVIALPTNAARSTIISGERLFSEAYRAAMHVRPRVFDPNGDPAKEPFMKRRAHARHQPTVLLVEDDEVTRNVMTRILVREGYLTLTAESSHDALSILRAPLEPIDVVILDVHLPDVSGTDLCARIRELNPNLPVVVCTGEADSDEAAQLLDMGVHRYFRKPIAIEELLATVEAALPE